MKINFGQSALNLKGVLVFAMVIFILTAGNALAMEGIHTGGFVTHTYIGTTENTYAVANSEDGSPEFFEGAVFFITNPVDKLRIGIQLFGSDYGKDRNGIVNVDWAYGDYRFKDYLGVRIGKIKTPIGLYNQYRDIDMVRTSVMLPLSMYDESGRDFNTAFEGGSLYGTVETGGAGDLEYEGYYGVSSVPDPNSGFWRMVNTWVASGVAHGVQAGLEAAGMTEVETKGSYNDPFVRWNYQYGGNLIWNTPLEGFKVGGTYGYADITLGTDVTVNYTATIPGVPMPTTGTEEVAYSLDVFRTTSGFFGQYTWNRLKVAGEYRTITMIQEVDGEEIDETVAEYYYGQVDYQVLDKLTLGVYYDVTIPDVDDDLDDFLNYEKDLNFSARYDINSNWLIKGDLHMVNGYSSEIGLSEGDDPKENWMIYAIRNTFYF